MNNPRYWAKILKSDGCWEWTGHIDRDGYGRFGDPGGGRMVLAHRIAYTALVGPIPEGLVIDHLCRNRSCVNPEHMEPVTWQENIRRGLHNNKNTGVTHCKRGHPFDEANTYVYRGHRGCRTCRAASNPYTEQRREYYRQRYLARKAA